MKSLGIITLLLVISALSYQCGLRSNVASFSDGAWGLIIIGLALLVMGIEDSAQLHGKDQPHDEDDKDG
jgi:hypothetical protein